MTAAISSFLEVKPHTTPMPFYNPDSRSPSGVNEWSNIQAITYDGAAIGSQKTKVFAYVGFPAGASADKKVPAIVLVHGGGGHAYAEWIKLWTDRGYAAIAMDTTGYFPSAQGKGIAGRGSDVPDLWHYGLYGDFAEAGYGDAPNNDEMHAYSQTLELVGPPMEASWFFQQGLTGFRCLADDCIQIAPHVYLLGNFPVPGPEEAVHPSSVMEGPDGRLVLDTFPEEQVCVVDTPAGLVVLTGCAHNGIRNILSTVERRFPERPIQAVFGGTHLVPPDPERIARTADYFRHSSITCAGVCHCTGPIGLEVFAQTVPAYLPTGAGLVWQTPSFARTSAGRKES